MLAGRMNGLNRGERITGFTPGLQWVCYFFLFTRMNSDELLRTKINQETSRLPWSELLKHFASGTIIAVASELDLVEVAFQISSDNKALVEEWLSANSVAKVSDEQAKIWLETEAQLWTVVVKPWILVQACT